jgi:penicillin-insensitive murein endopeptidase
MQKSVFLALFMASQSLSANPTPAGYHNKGTLAGGVNIFHVIMQNPALLATASPEELQYGTQEMVDIILDIAHFSATLGMTPVVIGDISRKSGGKLGRHLTHQRGLDADIAYIARGKKKSGHRSDKYDNRFTELYEQKRKVTQNFDLEANYKLIERLVARSDVQSIFVGCGVYDALETRDQKSATSALKHVYAQKGHEDHFHLRVRCPADASGCKNEWWSFKHNAPEVDDEKDHDSNAKWSDC